MQVFDGTIYAATATSGLWQSNDGTAWTVALPAQAGANPGGALRDNIVATLGRYLDLQQETFNQHLAALYGVAARMGAELKGIAGLSISELIGNELAALGAPQTLRQALEQDVTAAMPALRTAQQLATAVTALSLSAPEVGLAKGIDSIGVPCPPTLAAVQALGLFKQLVTAFQDTQNLLLHVLTLDRTAALSPLAKLAGWDDAAASALDGTFTTETWFTGPSITLGEVALLQSYFDTAKVLGIDTGTVWDLAQLAGLSPNTAREPAENAAAHGLWGGLQSHYGGQPAILDGIQARLNEEWRDHLVPLVIFQLANPDIATPRDLYAYLLIDVEVSGVVMTSPVVEAISAVQLYVYRCLNNLEAGVTVTPGLAGLWEWMRNFRVWQANKEVFLYPEDYIQPELRKNQTDLFATAEAALKQADLTNPDDIAAIFREYMNGFATLGGLTIVGSAACDLQVDGTAVKKLCLVGRTAEDPQHYYHRVASFAYSARRGRYAPADWGP